MARILMVDDEPGLRLFYSEEVADEGYEVVSAKGCEDAAAVLRNQ